MKVILEKDTDLKNLENKVNEYLERLDSEGGSIKGLTYAAESYPVMRGDKVTGNKIEYSVMIAYAPFIGA